MTKKYFQNKIPQIINCYRCERSQEIEFIESFYGCESGNAIFSLPRGWFIQTDSDNLIYFFCSDECVVMEDI